MPGLELCLANLALQEKFIETAAKAVIKSWAEDTMKESQNEFCPVDTGRLRGTGKVTVYKDTDKEYVLKLSYNSSGVADYAVYVHQIPMYHKRGQWQYLLTPFNRNIPKLKAMLLTVRV